MEQSRNQQGLLAAVWTLTGIAGILVALRLLVRLKIKKFAGWDDLVLVFSLVLVLANAALYTYASGKGLGRHSSNLTKSQRVQTEKWYFIGSVILDQIYAWPKLSVAILLHRLFSPHPAVLAIFYSAVTTLIVYTIVLSIFECVRCKPIKGLWNPDVHAVCWNPKQLADLAIFTGPYSAAIDFLFAFYPAKKLSDLQMPIQRKIGLCCLMGMGVLAGAIAIVKTVQLPRLNHTDDLTYELAIIALWSFVEADVVIIVASIPVLGALATGPSQRPSAVSKMRTALWPFTFRSTPSSHGNPAIPLQGGAPQRVQTHGSHATENAEAKVTEGGAPHDKPHPETSAAIMKQTDITVYEEENRRRSSINASKLTAAVPDLHLG